MTVAGLGKHNYHAALVYRGLRGSHAFYCLIYVLIQRIAAVGGDNDVGRHSRGAALSVQKAAACLMRKQRIARKVASEGIEVIISNGKRPGVLLELVHVNPATGCNEIAPEVRCTRFIADGHATSNVKKWIAHSEDFSKGAIYINEGAIQALHGEKAASILPVGVTRIEGAFEADDIVRILSDADGSRLGVGKISCSSERAQKVIGKKGQKPLVHYDYLWLE